MRSKEELASAVREALTFLKAQPDVQDAMVFASANERRIARLAYTSHFPCEGVIEVKGSDDFGLSLSLVLRGEDGKVLSGFGQTTSDLSLEAVDGALAKARRDASEDPDFHGLARLEDFRGLKAAVQPGYHDAGIMDVSAEIDAGVVTKAGWETLRGAVREFDQYCKTRGVSAAEAGFIVSGDQFVIRERMAVGTSSGIFDTDESTILLSFVTAMIEQAESKGSGFDAVMYAVDFRPWDVGRQAALNAVKGVGGVRIPTGKYTVVFGPQAIVDLFHLINFSLYLWSVEANTGIFVGQYGKQVASPLLTIIDDGSAPGLAGTKRITCEGYPTRRIELIRNGVLKGYLTNDYLSRRVLGNPEKAAEALGVDPREILDVLMPAANGFRFTRGGGRIAASPPSISATNVLIESSEPLTEEELLERVQNGVYIGRLWYTYPVGGFGTGIFSGTAVADSYLIRDGKLAEPLKPNTIRITDNLQRLLNAIVGITGRKVPTIVWASDEVVYAPWIAVKDVPLEEISKFLG